jgi:type IV secretion system protein VirD4
VEDAAGQIAGFGVKLWPILQDLSQLKALYETRWETFLGNAGILQFFGNNDLSTLEWISKRCGRTSITVTNTSDVTVSSRMGGAKGISKGTEVYDLLTIDEAARYFRAG